MVLTNSCPVIARLWRLSEPHIKGSVIALPDREGKKWSQKAADREVSRTKI